MKKVLLVEDELLARSGMKAIIDWEENGFHLVADVSHGQEALKVLQQHPVDIVLTDIRMPVMDGLTLIETIRKRELPCEVIVLSSYDDFRYVRKAMQFGVRDYIHKPTMTPDELIGTLKKAAEELDKKRSVERYRQMIVDFAEESRDVLLKKVVKQIVDSGSSALDPHITKILDSGYILNEPFYLCLFRIFFPGGSGAEWPPFLSVEQIARTFTGNQAGDPNCFPVYLREKNEWLFLSRVHPEKTLRDFEQYVDRFGCQLVWEVADEKSDFFHMNKIYRKLSQAVSERWETTQQHRRRHPLIQKAISYMHEHYMDPLTLEKVSGYIHINPSYFSRLFYKETGESFTDYLTNYRLRMAEQLLLQTNLPVYQIADRVGYCNSKYFLKVFRKRFGMTPGEFRRKNAGNGQ